MVAPASDRASLAALTHISHEIRTPLNAILVLAQLMRDGQAGPLNPEQQQYIEIIERNGRCLVDLADSVLDLSRRGPRQPDLVLGPLDLGEQLRSTAAALTPLARAKGIALLVDVADDLPLVDCDANRLRQVLTNLIGNAIKFTDIGEVTLRTEARDAVVAVHVCDTGVGIPELARSRIFEELFQVGEASDTRKGEGIGLGLAIVDRLVRLMGGDLSVDSAQGAGSKFTFTLPISAAAASRRAAMDGFVESSFATTGSDRAVAGVRSTLPFRDESDGANPSRR